ncbi:UNVERIFIED_ORG: hypothetical protein M2187_008399 [Bradyrhizobium japonicum]
MPRPANPGGRDRERGHVRARRPVLGPAGCSHSCIAPASCSTSIAQPRSVRIRGLRFVISIEIAPAKTNPSARLARSARVSAGQGFAIGRVGLVNVFREACGDARALRSQHLDLLMCADHAIAEQVDSLRKDANGP